MQSEDSVDPTKVAATVATSTATSVAADANSSEDSLQDDASAAAEVAANQPGAIRVIRRNGKVTLFGKDKISVAVTKAFLAVEGGTGAASARIREHVATITERVVNAVTRNLTSGGTIHIEDIQDHVELALMRSGHHKVAREYVLYREEQSRKRREQAVSAQVSSVEPE
ncbi:MAG: ribonucleoside-diphosphate reductase subunit alpha, partial [Proteobacteria bacterium]|nr:ribonucleoside-diphosphate reductase subunit alpha [Pseudomonadota bacterium]